MWTGHVTTLHRLKETVIDRDVLDDPTWAKLLQLEAIRTAMFSAKVHERIGEIDKEANVWKIEP